MQYTSKFSGEEIDSILDSVRDKQDAIPDLETIRSNAKNASDTIARMVESGYLFAGIATIDTNPRIHDAKVFYIANGKGTYTNFGGIEVTEDDVVVLYWDSAWHKVATGIASQAKLSELEEATVSIKENDDISDLDIEDNNRYVLARFTKGDFQTKNFNSANIVNKTVIRILSISNSYGCDALSFVPQIMKGLGCQVECAVAYHGGASLYQHYANIGTNFYTYWYTDEQIWKSESSKSLEYIVKAQNWDYIIFQQGSSDSGKFDTYEPYLSNLIKYVSGLIDHKTKICFNMTQPYALGYSGLSVYSDSQDVMYASIEDATKNVYTSVGIETIIPVGIAIQLARQTTLNSYGSYSQGQLSSDGTHLDGGIGRLVAGYTWIMALLRDELNLSIWNSHFYPSRSMGLVLPDDNRGSWVDVTEDMSFIAKQCACKAVNKMYTILNNN